MDIHRGRVLIIANPAAKHGEGAKAAYQVRRLLRETLGPKVVDEIQTTGPGHARQLAADAAGTYTTVVAVGGDGIIHETTNGLMAIGMEERPVLGVVPVGSGNDYARTLELAMDVQEAVAQLLQAKTMSYDIGNVNGEYFVETLSFGLDAAIALGTMERRKHTRKTGGALYFEVGIDQLLHHLDAYHIHVHFDNERTIDTRSIMFAVQIGQTYGGGFRVCPTAKPNDGLFDICYAEGVWSVPRAVAVFARAKNGWHTKARGIRFEQAARLRIHFETEPPVQADGEKLTGTDFDIRIHSGALQVLCPMK